ncbi:hypothetical protein [Pseudomonas sp.]|jgi:hypothetical protein|uniref:hypothetical protein n=1 Tax=Pseudomonas sp. TaxID=306 RepID=UPI0039C9AD04
MEIDENAPGNRSQQAVKRTTGNETGNDPGFEKSEVPLAPDGEAPVDEDMTDVEAANSISTEHPEPGSDGDSRKPSETDTTSSQDVDIKEPRGVPASDPESGA